MGSVLTNDTLMSDLKPLANEIIHAPALMFFANKAIFFVSKVRTDPTFPHFSTFPPPPPTVSRIATMTDAQATR